jgi:hypothetical protein
MKLLPLKYLTILIILLFSLKNSKDQLNHVNKELGKFTTSLCLENEPPEKNCQNSELRENRFRPTNHGEKVETIVITCHAKNHSEVRLINIPTLQKFAFSKRNHSLISHYFLLFSQTLHLSPFINNLRI